MSQANVDVRVLHGVFVKMRLCADVARQTGSTS